MTDDKLYTSLSINNIMAIQLTLKMTVACRVVYNFARFAADGVKGRQVATGNGASCPWQQHDFQVKTWWPNFGRALLNW